MIKYTIRSISGEGEYYLVNHWNRYKTYWKRHHELEPSMLFDSTSDAKRSLTKLLKIMPDYESDKTEVVEIIFPD